MISKIELKDRYNPENPFWIEHFYTPEWRPDDITDIEYERLTDTYKDDFEKLILKESNEQ